MLDPFKQRIAEQPWVSMYQMPTELAKCDIGLTPLQDIQFNRSRSSIKFCECGAVGVPVVASPLPCYTDVIKHGENGFIAEGNATAAWYEALTALVQDAELRKKIGLAARRTVVERFDIRITVPQWIEAYRTIGRLP